MFAIKMIAIGLLVIVLARPQSKTSWKNITTEGIDIVLAMDISASMLAKDFKPNRLESAKEVAIEFVNARPNDRVGLVIFSGESFTQCPLTTDHAIIKNLMSEIKTGMVADGTAIGMGLATSISRIKDSKAKSKVIILLTDGVNNMGAVAPQTAADIAKAFGVRVYTIGVGTQGKALAPVAMYPNGQYVFDYVAVDLDEKMMQNIADMTGGKYFRATNNDKLASIYKEIDHLEKTIVEERKHTRRTEEFFPFALTAGILLLLDFILKNTVLRSLP
jgi:Ca-activated chloride channel family protein